MLDDVLRYALQPPYEAALQLGLILIASALFTMLAIRLTISLVSIARIKARKEWTIEPRIGKEESLLTHLLRREVDESTQQVFFTEEVRQMLAHASAAENHSR